MAEKASAAAALLKASEGHLADDEPLKARKTAEEAQALFKELGNGAGGLEALRALALAEVAGGQVEPGLAKLREGLSGAGKDKHGEGVMQLALAEAALMTQEPEEGLARAKQAIEAFSGEKSWRAKALLASSSAQLELEAWKEGKEAAEAARALFKEAGDRLGEGSACEQLAAALLSSDIAAAAALQSAVDIYRAEGAHRELGVALASLAEMNLTEGNSAGEALKLAKEAWEASKEAKHTQGVAGALGLVAQSWVALGRPQEAEDAMEAEAERCRTDDNAAGEAAALSALCQARLTMDDAEGALAVARRALGALGKAKDGKGSARVLHSIATLEYARGFWEMAIRAAKEALAVLGDAGGSLKAAGDLETILAGSYDARGQEPPSSVTREKALKVIKELGTALEEQNVDAFDMALKRLQRQSGVTPKDQDRAFAPALEKDPEKAQEFLGKRIEGGYQKARFPPEQPDLEREPDFSIRSFPVREHESGSTKEGIEWTQTRGSMTMWFDIEKLPNTGPHGEMVGGWRQEDFTVEMSRRAMKVAVDGQPVKALSGDFTEQIWVKHSWWTLEDGLLEFRLSKRTFATWKSPWWAYNNLTESGTLTQFKRIPYTWTRPQSQRQAEALSGEALFAEWGGRVTFKEVRHERDLELKLPGVISREDEGPSYQRSSFAEVFQGNDEKFFCSADEVVVGLSLAQDWREDAKSVTITVHLDRFRFEDLKARVPLEDIFGVDVWEREVCIFLQGDKQNPILWAELGGACVPAATTMRFATTDVKEFRSRQQTAGSASPTLEVVLLRQSPERWERVFSCSVQHKMLPRDGAIEAPEAERFEGLREVPTLRRSGCDLARDDFWSYVEDYVGDTMKRTGHSTLPKKLEVN